MQDTMRTTPYRVLMLDSEEEYEQLIAELGAYAHEGIARCNRGQALAELGRVDEALADFAAASELLPREAVPRMNRGTLLEHLERHDEALAEYGAALAIAPDEVSYRRTRADLLHRLGRFEDAIADYDAAIRLESEFQFTIDARERARNRQPCDEDDDGDEIE